MKNRFSRLNSVKTVSNMSQSVRNIITSDQKHILDLNKSHKDRLKKRSSAALWAGGRSLLDFRFYYVALSYLVVKCLHIFLHTLFTEHLTTRIITYEIQGTELYLINVNQFTQFFLIYHYIFYLFSAGPLYKFCALGHNRIQDWA